MKIRALIVVFFASLAAITIGGASLIGGGVAGAVLGTSGLAFAHWPLSAA